MPIRHARDKQGQVDGARSPCQVAQRGITLQERIFGAANGFQITATETADDGNPATGLSALNFDATTGAANSQLTLNQYAQDAQATVNGIAVSSSTNQLSNISDGLSITLLKKSDTPIDITVSDDTASMQKAITDFVSAYSQLQSYISLETKYDPSTAVQPGTSRSDSPLTGDASVIGKDWLAVADLPSSVLSGATSAKHQPTGSGLSGDSDQVISALLKSATPVSGSWGSGRLIKTSLISVLMTSNGRVFVGAVTPQVLYSAAAQAAK